METITEGYEERIETQYKIIKFLLDHQIPEILKSKSMESMNAEEWDRLNSFFGHLQHCGNVIQEHKGKPDRRKFLRGE